jgi:hypothetical protein
VKPLAPHLLRGWCLGDPRGSSWPRTPDCLVDLDLAGFGNPHGDLIADRLGLSLKTVNNNTSSIFTKLNVGTRTEAAILARDRGLTRPDQRSTEGTADS